MKTRKHKLSSPNLLLSATCQQDLEETTNWASFSPSCDTTQEVVHSLKLKPSLGKIGVGGGRLLSFWEGLCSVAILVSGIYPWKLTYPLKSLKFDAWKMKLPFLRCYQVVNKNDWNCMDNIYQLHLYTYAQKEGGRVNLGKVDMWLCLPLFLPSLSVSFIGTLVGK